MPQVDIEEWLDLGQIKGELKKAKQYVLRQEFVRALNVVEELDGMLEGNAPVIKEFIGELEDLMRESDQLERRADRLVDKIEDWKKPRVASDQARVAQQLLDMAKQITE